MDFLDIHTHKAAQQPGIISIQSLSLTSDIFLAMPKTKPISIGLHPWYASIDKFPTQMAYLKVLAQQQNVKLIGECGLDKLKGAPLPDQITMFEAQIHLAETLNKPMIIHCVRAFQELIAMKKRLKAQVPMIIHGFNKNETLGKQLINQGFLLSFGSGILQSSSGIARLIQTGHPFFLETDDSATDIAEIYQAASILKNCSVDELKACIFENWKRINLI